MRQGRFVFALIGLAPLACMPGMSPARAADAADCFRIFDATAYRAKPDLAQYGVQPAEVLYSVRQLWLNEKSPERLAQLPSKTVVNATVKRLGYMRVKPPLIIVDVEHWPNLGSDAEVMASVEKYVTLIDWIKTSAAGTPVGYYGVPPLRDYWRAIGDSASAPYKQWQAENDRFQKLSDQVDVLAPSLYTFYDDVEGWKRYAAANVREARRLAPGKPVYPFIWPQYHNSNRKLDGQYLSGDYWRQQLQTLEGMADGVVIWAGGPGPWPMDAEWWHATLAFIESSRKVCKPHGG